MSLPAARVKEEPGCVGPEVPEHDFVNNVAVTDYVDSTQEPSGFESESGSGDEPAAASVKRELVADLDEQETWCLDSGSHINDPLESDLGSVKQETFGVSKGTVTIKDELVLGPEHVQRPGTNYVLSPPMSRACVVRVPRAAALEAQVSGAGRDPEQLQSLRFVHCELCKTIKSIDVNKRYRKAPHCDACLVRAFKELNNLNIRKFQTCNICQCRAMRLKLLYRKSYTCETCKNIFNKNLIEHKGVKVRYLIKPNSCNLSKVVYYDGLKTHKLIEAEVSVVYCCQICRKKFKRKRELEEHKRYHSREWSCNVCEKGFNRLRDLNIHRYVCRMISKPRLCKACVTQKALKQLNNLRKSKEIESKPYYCELCNYGST